MYICMYVCMYVRILAYVCVYVCMYVLTYVWLLQVARSGIKRDRPEEEVATASDAWGEDGDVMDLDEEDGAENSQREDAEEGGGEDEDEDEECEGEEEEEEEKGEDEEEDEAPASKKARKKGAVLCMRCHKGPQETLLPQPQRQAFGIFGIASR